MCSGVKISQKFKGPFGLLVLRNWGPSFFFRARFVFSDIFYPSGIEISQNYIKGHLGPWSNHFVGPHLILRATDLRAHLISTPVCADNQHLTIATYLVMVKVWSIGICIYFTILKLFILFSVFFDTVVCVFNWYVPLLPLPPPFSFSLCLILIIFLQSECSSWIVDSGEF